LEHRPNARVFEEPYLEPWATALEAPQGHDEENGTREEGNEISNDTDADENAAGAGIHDPSSSAGCPHALS